MAKNSKRVTGQHHEAHSLFSLQIKFLANVQKKELTSGEVVALNVLLVAASTAFIESVISELLLGLLNKANTSFFTRDKSMDINTMAMNIRNQQRKQIKKGTFSAYKEMIKDFTGKRFDFFTNQKSWVAVQTLFEMRNHFMHGNNLGIIQWHEIDAEKEYENDTKGTSHLHETAIEIEGMKGYQNYLFDQKLIDRTNLPTGPRDVLNLSIMLHFLQHAVDFIEQAHNNINAKYELPPIFTFGWSIEALRRELENLK